MRIEKCFNFGNLAKYTECCYKVNRDPNGAASIPTLIMLLCP